MKIKTHIIAGQQTNLSDATPGEYAMSILDGLTETLQGDVKNLRLWSFNRIKGDGFSNWLIVSQKPSV